MEYRKFADSYFVRMDRGEEILDCLKTLCQTENIRLASVQGLGAVNEVMLGVFHCDTKEYHSETYRQDMEIAACHGTVSTQEGQVYLHIHMVVGNPEQQFCRGGHLNRAVISATGEFVVTAFSGTVERRFSPEIGLNLFEFDGNGEEKKNG